VNRRDSGAARQSANASSETEIDSAFATLVRQRADALFVAAAGRAHLATRGAQSPPQTAQARQALADRRIVHSAAAPASRLFSTSSSPRVRRAPDRASEAAEGVHAGLCAASSGADRAPHRRDAQKHSNCARTCSRGKWGG
jgi:hypothetical protein